MRFIIVDDEEVYAMQLRMFAAKHGGLECLGQFSDVDAAQRFIHAHPEIDLAFFDVRIGKDLGTDLARGVNIPYLVFVSSFPEYAIDGFELDAVDFILKPVTADRFNRAMSKVMALDSLGSAKAKAQAADARTTVAVQSGTDHYLIPVADIDYLKSYGDYLFIHYNGKRLVARLGIPDLLSQVPDGVFLRTHRSYVVNISHIRRTGKAEVYLYSGDVIPVSRRMRTDAMDQILARTA